MCKYVVITSPKPYNLSQASNTLAGVKLGVCISPYSTPTLTHIDSTIDIIYDSTIHESRNIKYIKTLRKK